MKTVLILMLIVVTLSLVGAGIYGFVASLPLWGMPILLGFLSGFTTMVAYKEL